jgi:hypothetical protein
MSETSDRVKKIVEHRCQRTGHREPLIDDPARGGLDIVRRSWLSEFEVEIPTTPPEDHDRGTPSTISTRTA